MDPLQSLYQLLYLNQALLLDSTVAIDTDLNKLSSIKVAQIQQAHHLVLALKLIEPQFQIHLLHHQYLIPHSYKCYLRF